MSYKDGLEYISPFLLVLLLSIFISDFLFDVPTSPKPLPEDDANNEFTSLVDKGDRGQPRKRKQERCTKKPSTIEMERKIETEKNIIQYEVEENEMGRATSDGVNEEEDCIVLRFPCCCQSF
mmetsp:Transcript_25800/g.60489  ORF Transcript_25800/g.60489 Transcript_25800/m.60489 type:complete len:122 (-) Transcript_25800:159-524(-)